MNRLLLISCFFAVVHCGSHSQGKVDYYILIDFEMTRHPDDKCTTQLGAAKVEEYVAAMQKDFNNQDGYMACGFSSSGETMSGVIVAAVDSKWKLDDDGCPIVKMGACNSKGDVYEKIAKWDCSKVDSLKCPPPPNESTSGAVETAGAASAMVLLLIAASLM
eukprot:gnl/TRDRNA2_/TRDRNA2_77445_c0_seq1.p1 gnl/TRDRNA2_/TRDRNA2_77445_c0~~gnl/TRDRNA2_/TRDRNA2_77445_c0_seq1.p1  ORF type:complete len:162 (+),score=28.37 gnl/TRDRNA2_/TRDRNA2_77445_c0_seq1:64-549(+)